MLAVQPGGLGSADEELRAVGVGTSVGHGEDTFASVLQVEVLVFELVAIDGLSTSAVVVGEITALAPTGLDHDYTRRVANMKPGMTLWKVDPA